ncbi:WD40 repeat [Pyrenophora seminiperda CCB06]|uniref:WD40 repeat n=1 Tax=Pyrenophora seminiperda CCB06 TaxID=1302712 RepID=A0A3M7M5M0_9PLEO|nr:WD40 repeat [Pyrenophora seminiperda CCB06]
MVNAFNIINGRVFTPGLGIILAPQPFTPEGGDFLHVALDVSGDGKLPVPPRNIADPLTQVFNFTLFLTSTVMQKNFTISNVSTSTPPFANIMNQESGQTVKHINFEWPDCLVGNNNDDDGATARGDYNISIHQNYRLNGVDRYTIFNLPISVTNSISQFPGAGQLTTKPAPGPLSANGGRMPCNMLQNPMVDFETLVNSVNNPPGQPMQDIKLQTAPRKDGGQVGANGVGGNGVGGNGQGEIAPGRAGNGNGEALGGAVRISSESLSVVMIGMLGFYKTMTTRLEQEELDNINLIYTHALPIIKQQNNIDDSLVLQTATILNKACVNRNRSVPELRFISTYLTVLALDFLATATFIEGPLPVKPALRFRYREDKTFALELVDKNCNKIKADAEVDGYGDEKLFDVEDVELEDISINYDVDGNEKLYYARVDEVLDLDPMDLDPPVSNDTRDDNEERCEVIHVMFVSTPSAKEWVAARNLVMDLRKKGLSKARILFLEGETGTFQYSDDPTTFDGEDAMKLYSLFHPVRTEKIPRARRDAREIHTRTLNFSDVPAYMWIKKKFDEMKKEEEDGSDLYSDESDRSDESDESDGSGESGESGESDELEG